MNIPAIMALKNSERKITALTAFDYALAHILNLTEIDLVLVGDSLGMVALGYETTLPVTMDEMIHHTQAVRRGIDNALLVGDMPFMSYQISDSEAIKNAGRFIKEGGAEAVKIEGGLNVVNRIRAITNAGISVMGHIGLTPQSVHQFGGYKIQGTNSQDANQIKNNAQELQQAGVFAIVLEGIPTKLAKEITKTLDIPTIGIGAGIHCDGQILVLHDMLGLNSDPSPKFVKVFDELGKRVKEAVKAYIESVQEGTYPGEEHSYNPKTKTLRQINSNKNR